MRIYVKGFWEIVGWCCDVKVYIVIEILGYWRIIGYLLRKIEFRKVVLVLEKEVMCDIDGIFEIVELLKFLVF